MITLDKNYSIQTDTHSWKLVFSEPRERENKKTKKLEPYIFEDFWYYPTLQDCLTKYTDIALKQCNENVLQILKKLEQIEKTILSISKICVVNGNLKQF